MGVEVEYGPIGSVRQFIQEKTMANDETIVLEQLNAKLRELADDELTRLIGKCLIIQDAKIERLTGCVTGTWQDGYAHAHDEDLEEIERMKKRVVELEALRTDDHECIGKPPL